MGKERARDTGVKIRVEGTKREEELKGLQNVSNVEGSLLGSVRREPTLATDVAKRDTWPTFARTRSATTAVKRGI
jgi:hypothetical protein